MLRQDFQLQLSFLIQLILCQQAPLLHYSVHNPQIFSDRRSLAFAAVLLPLLAFQAPRQLEALSSPKVLNTFCAAFLKDQGPKFELGWLLTYLRLADVRRVEICGLSRADVVAHALHGRLLVEIDFDLVDVLLDAARLGVLHCVDDGDGRRPELESQVDRDCRDEAAVEAGHGVVAELQTG